MNISFRVEGLDRLQRLLGNDFNGVMRNISRAVGELVRNKLAVYPGSPRHPIRWASERQRRFYFAMRRERRLPIGYTRQFDPMSQRLGPSWAVSAYSTIGAKVATHVTYAPYVQSAAQQQPMHADTGWVTDQQAVDTVQRSGDILRVVTAALSKALRR